MKDRSLLVIDGYSCGYGRHNEHVVKIVAILEENGVVYKGFGLSNQDCNLDDYNSVFHCLLRLCTEENPESMVAGYYEQSILQYMNLLENKKITYGKFQFDGECYSGREKYCDGQKLKRDLNRVVTKYTVPCKITGYDDLYTVVETALMKQQKNSTWQGIQYSVECMAPVEQKTYVLLPTSTELNQ